MSRIHGICSKSLLGSGIALAMFLPLGTAQAQTLSALYTFTGGADGNNPSTGLVADSSGNLYGTTFNGGAHGDGVVFQVTPGGAETVLYSFSGSPDGANPAAGLIRLHNGTSYGTTENGGASGGGTVFMLSKTGVETVLHSFSGGPDGFNPFGALIRDSAGNLYGTTGDGGTGGCGVGCGTVFKVSAAGVETVLYSFTGGSDGVDPVGSLIRDSSGNLYGTTETGGAHGNGTVFELSPAGAETILYSFAGTPDGSGPEAALLRKGANFYGTTNVGGVDDAGTVFNLKRGTEKVLHSFTESPDGSSPQGALIEDAAMAGTFYGTTYGSGSSAYGTVFSVTTSGSENVLASFNGSNGPGPGATGAFPNGGLLQDSSGNVYGTATDGGSIFVNGGWVTGAGTVFKLVP